MRSDTEKNLLHSNVAQCHKHVNISLSKRFIEHHSFYMQFSNPGGRETLYHKDKNFTKQQYIFELLRSGGGWWWR